VGLKQISFFSQPAFWKSLAFRISLLFVLCSQFPASAFAQLSTTDHLAEPGFWPTQKATSRSEYAGSAACASCHAAKVASQKTTPMARNAMHADDSDILHSHPEMKFSTVQYHYQIRTDAKHSVYTIDDGTHTLTATLLWAFGVGHAGQSYLFKKDDGNFYEARVTYFSTLKTIEFTPARALSSPKGIEEAMYRPVSASEISRCFGCHTTASTVGDQFDEKNLMLGVTCEACHDGGAKHVALAQAASLAGMTDESPGGVFNPAKLNPTDSVDFCGACHSTWWDVKLSGVKGASTARSQPYRLETSKCWGKGDARLTCIGCHDPHKPLETEASAYDKVCSSCHVGTGEKQSATHPGSACPVNTKNCVSCHMDKVYVPEMHFKFTDHRIRVVRANESFPE
jgi:Cytochrome c554 and c-prime